MFSKRFEYDIRENKLSRLLKDKKSAGINILDLTESNPSGANINYNETGILSSMSLPGSLKYSPEPKGLKTAREAVSRYYKEKNVYIDAENVFLTSGTSEAYSFVFKLIADPNDEILISRPGYPLFSFIAEMESVKIRQYDLKYSSSGFWEVDFDSLKSKITGKTKAIIMVNPNNPTGSFLKAKDINIISKLCKENDIAIICDEVFLDYFIEADRSNIFSLAGINHVLTFTLSGLSKICGLPQMKLSWIVVSGPPKICEEAKERMEIITDTYLSVGTPVQLAAENLLIGKELIQAQIRERISENYKFLKAELIGNKTAELLKTEGGWYTVLKIKLNMDEEMMAYGLLKEKDVYIHPGYFFDFKEEGYIVLSLLTPERIFSSGVKRILEYLKSTK